MRNNNSQVVLGYQIRVPIDQLASLWMQERRDQYLLNMGVEFPLSADRRVWPVADHPALVRQLFDDFESGPYQAPNGLSLFRLKKNAISDVTSLSKNGDVVIAIGVESDMANHLRDKHSIKLLGDEETPSGSHVQLLGFDVCDEWLLSGLMNCGMDASDQAALRQKYAGKINLHGLFDDYETASNYSLDVNKIIPEHAPFFPASIFIPKT